MLSLSPSSLTFVNDGLVLFSGSLNRLSLVVHLKVGKCVKCKGGGELGEGGGLLLELLLLLLLLLLRERGGSGGGKWLGDGLGLG